MYTYIIYILAIIGIFILYKFLLKKKKFRKGIYEISVRYKNEIPTYYFMMEWRPGKFIDTRKLTKSNFLFIPEEACSILKKTYHDYESAQSALEEFRTKI